jgi:hypothetical protein
MSDPFYYDPPLRVWVAPRNPADYAPLPALLYSSTDDEVLVSEYDRGKKVFSDKKIARQTTANKDFNVIKLEMLAEQGRVLEKAKEEYTNQASVYSHIYDLKPNAYPENAYKLHLEKEEEKEEEKVVTPAKPKPATRRRR